MKLYADGTKVTMFTLHDIATELGIQVYDYDHLGHRVRGKYAGRDAYKFVLRPPYHGKNAAKPTREQKYRLIKDKLWNDGGKGDGRRAAWAVCWHGHWEFMMGVFDHDPNAIFVTRESTWDGVEDFLARAEASGTRNIGSQIMQASYNSQCNCDLNGGYLIRTHRNPVAV